MPRMRVMGLRRLIDFIGERRRRRAQVAKGAEDLIDA
jgi:hypothetical protein